MVKLIFGRFRQLFLIFILISTITACSQSETEIYVDDTNEALTLLEQQRSEAITALEQEVTAENVNKLIDLGSWTEADQFLKQSSGSGIDLSLAEARLLIKKHQYQQAEEVVQSVLQENPSHVGANVLKAKLDVQAWNLSEAALTAQEILEAEPENKDAGVIMGQVALLSRDYESALEWAEDVQSWYPDFADSYLLEAETQFWDQNPAEAEEALTRAIELDPFNADARFSYGYAIWRRVDATQLDDMANQWNLAMEVNPLHYLTHWHFGNGHTNLTYADYAEPSDSLVRARLAEADALIPEGRVDEAIAMSYEIESEYPESVLPEMFRGSAFYMHYNMDHIARIDSAQAAFESILERKQNYGPAHNGLAAVIKQRQFTYLNAYPQLEEVIDQTEIPEEESVFYDVFEDANYYPGDRVKKMIAQQIGPSKAYLSMIQMFDSDFAIPPLHKDLAEAMEQSYFRFGTTFDNRQWMDIRGVGSGATGIEYLERGAHLERNVLAHEYAHLYHGRILTDTESRRIRELYFAAKEGDYTLDYYASNNESEYFAQGYAGFLSESKVHPLNHKSMNTKEYIQEKDPDLYAFLDSLLQKQQAYLDGETELFDDNWAQTYVSLAGRSGWGGGPDIEQAAEYLETALSYSSDYLPALLEYADLHAEQGDFEAAADKITQAKEVDENYAPIYVTEANLMHQEALQGEITFQESIESQQALFEKVDSLETDLAERASVNRLFRSRLEEYGHVKEAMDVANEYAENGPTVSTYLRDRKEEAEAYADFLQSKLGFSEEVIEPFQELVGQNPQNFEYRRMYADVLYNAGDYEEALRVLEEGQRILESANNERADYTLRIARLMFDNSPEEALSMLSDLDEDELSSEDQVLLAELYIEAGETEEALSVIEAMDEPVTPIEKANRQYIEGKLAISSGEDESAIEHYQSALSENPYHLSARQELTELYEIQDNESAAEELSEEAEQLGINL